MKKEKPKYVCSAFLHVKVAQEFKNSNTDPKVSLRCTRGRHEALTDESWERSREMIILRLSPEGLAGWWQNPENEGIGGKWREEELLNLPSLPN